MKIDMRQMAAAEAVRRLLQKGRAHTYWEIAQAALDAADSAIRERPTPRTADMSQIVDAIQAGRA